jgi:hypothetical protein
MPLMLDLVGYLTAECCAGDPGQCAEVSAVLSRAMCSAAPVALNTRKKAQA